MTMKTTRMLKNLKKYKLESLDLNNNDIHIRPHRFEYLKRHPFFNFGILWNNLSDELKFIENRNKFSKSIKSRLINAL